MKLSVAMITRNPGPGLRKALESLKDLKADEIILVDTGTEQNTPAYALLKELENEFPNLELSQCLGPKGDWKDLPWIDDFGYARTEALRQCTGDYVFWMDSDDILVNAAMKSLNGLDLFRTLALNQLCWPFIGPEHKSVYGHLPRHFIFLLSQGEGTSVRYVPVVLPNEPHNQVRPGSLSSTPLSGFYVFGGSCFHTHCNKFR